MPVGSCSSRFDSVRQPGNICSLWCILLRLWYAWLQPHIQYRRISTISTKMSALHTLTIPKLYGRIIAKMMIEINGSEEFPLFSPFKYFHVLQNLQAHVAAQVAEAQQVAAKRQQAVSQMRGTDCVVGWLMAWKSSKIWVAGDELRGDMNPCSNCELLAFENRSLWSTCAVGTCQFHSQQTVQ